MGVFLNGTRFFIMEEFMLYEKKKILIERIICLIFLIAGIVMAICWERILIDSDFPIFLFIFIILFCLVLFICSLMLSCRIYSYDGKLIVVYSGFYHHYIKIDGVKTDEHNTILTYTAIYLSCTLKDGTNIDAAISMTNRISVKINNRLI